MWKLGTIGFGYPDWHGSVYPPDLREEDRLAAYAELYPAVELDTTFYGIPRSETFLRWKRQVSADFSFVLKAPQSLTHSTPLIVGPAAEEWRTLSAGIEILGPERSLILLQFPPSFAATESGLLGRILEDFPAPCPRLVELRHESWFVESTSALLEDHRCSWVASDLAPVGEAAHAPGTDGLGYRPLVPVHLGAVAYLRLCGVHAQFTQDSLELYDASPRIAWWLDQLGPLLGRQPRFLIAGNSFAGHAPGTLRRAARLLGQSEPTLAQPSLFGDF